MMKALIAVAAGLFAFVAGLAGAYLAVPALAPDLARQARADSLAVDSLGGSLPGDSLTFPADSLALLPDSGRRPVDPQALMAALNDSLAALRQRLEAEQRQNGTLAAEIADLRRETGQRQARRAEAAALSATITKLEDKELAGILQQLDLEMLESLYQEASARNRTRLLQHMPPRYVAGFVQRLMGNGDTPPTRPDSLSDAGSDSPPVGAAQ